MLDDAKEFAFAFLIILSIGRLVLWLIAWVPMECFAPAVCVGGSIWLWAAFSLVDWWRDRHEIRQMLKRYSDDT